MSTLSSRALRSLPFLPIVLLCGYALFGGGQLQEQILGLRQWYLSTFDYFTLYLSLACVVVCAALMIGPWRNVRLGGADARPEFSTFSWLSMLFAAGMGAGIVFWGVAEPLLFFNDPPSLLPLADTGEKASLAFSLTLFHWTIHPWAIYAVAGLAMAIAGTAALDLHTPGVSFPFLSGTTRRWIDWLATYSVIFGVVASMGQGALLIGSSLNDYFGGGSVQTLAVITMLCMTMAYLVSSASGLKAGIRILSNGNIILAGGFLLFVLLLGPTMEILSFVGPSVWEYLTQFWSLSVEVEDGAQPAQWKRDWSVAYFLWWIAWTPFVGAFIARISFGRTLKEFILGVIVAPTLVTLAWFITFGGAGITVQDAGVDLGVSVWTDALLASYRLLGEFPIAAVTQAALMILMACFLITSGDSGSYVLGVFSAHRPGEPPLSHRMTWGIVISILACAAVLSPSVQETNSAFAVLGAIPLSFLLLYQCGYVLFQAFQHHKQPVAQKGHTAQDSPSS